MIIGTAGHIDHGKSTLVRALTGVDTDRLKEEKARGISIELGYAYLPAATGEVLGFIDVPGHERLVHTMLAGACGIDAALVVVAADDGVMPQTREHVAILDLLGIADAAVAVTKIDRVGAERVAVVAAEVSALLAATGLRAAPTFTVNATAADDPGVRRLAMHLTSLRPALPRRRPSAHFRLAVDRVFTLAGHGTMVTGTVFAGRISAGDSVALLPDGLEVRVRSIHAQSRPAETGIAGQRVALNLAGVEPQRIRRGDWIADPRGLEATTRIDARLTLRPGAGPALGPWAPVHVHFGATHRTAHVVTLEDQPLVPGSTGRVQLVFDAPVCGAPGDRFIIRDARAIETIGGGTLLDPRAPPRRRRSAERRCFLDGVEALLANGRLAPLLDARPLGLSVAELTLATAAPLDQAAVPGDARLIHTGPRAADQFLVAAHHWARAGERLLLALEGFHAQAPDEPGPDAPRLRRIAAPGMAARLWGALVEELVGAAQVHRRGAWLQLPSHAAALTARDHAAADRLEPLLVGGGFDPPWVRELARRTAEPEDRVRQVLAVLGRAGRVHQVVHDLFYARESLQSLAAVLAGLAEGDGQIAAARFRDAIGVGRKRSIQILEFFDRVGYTRRLGNVRVLREGSGWRAAP